MFAKYVSRAVPLLLFGACAQTELKGKGILEGRNSVLILSLIFIVAAVGIIGSLVVLDRFLGGRHALKTLGSDAQEEEPSDEDEIIGGIRIGKAPVPRWLYAAYLIIPAFALLYVTNSAEFVPKAPKPAAKRAEKLSAEPTITAKNIQFSKPTLKLPASTEISLTFENKDTVPHNLAIYSDSSRQTPLFNGNIFNGPKQMVYQFSSPPAGTYYFQCDVHPGMKGAVESVEAGQAA